MKFALVLTGLARCWEKSYPSFKSNIIDRYAPDVYLDLWSEVGFYSGKSYLQGPGDEFVKLAEGDRGFHTSGELVDVTQMMNVYRPVGVHVDDFSLYEAAMEERATPFVNAYTRPKNTVSQAYKIHRGMSHVLGQYDIVFRARPDLVLQAPLPSFDFNVMITEKVVATLPSRNKLNTGTGDSFMVGSHSAVTAFANMQWANLETFYAQGGVSCPHLFAQMAIKFAGLTHAEIHIPAYIEHSPNGVYQEPE